MAFEDRPNIVEFILAPSGFGKHRAFRDLGSWKSWITFLRTLYAIDFTGAEEYDSFRHFTDRIEPPTTPFQESWVCCGRRGGKSFISAVVAVYEALTGNWSERLSGGESPVIFIVASDKAQARNIFKYCEGLLDVAAPKFIKRATREEIELANGVEISIKAGNYAGIRGFSVVLGICDEAAFMRDESGGYSSPIQEIYNSLIPSLIPEKDGLPGGKLLFLSTPRSKSGMLFERFEEYWGIDNPDVLCWRGSTEEMHPGYISEAKVQKDLTRDRSLFQAEWLGLWREDISNLMDADLLRSAMGDHLPRPYDPSKRYVGFIDASSGKSDSFTISIGFKETYGGQIVIARAEERRAPFTPGDVVKEFAALAHSYHLTSLYSDAYARGWVEETFRRENIRIEVVKESKSQLYIQFQGLLQLGQLWLPNDKRAETQFLQLERTEARDGTWRVDHPSYGSGMDDLANSIAGCATVLGQEKLTWTREEVEARMPVPVHRSPEGARRQTMAEMSEEIRGWMEETSGQRMNRILR